MCRAVDALGVQMVAQLLSALRTKSPLLAACLRVVGWLRRVDLFPENMLRIQFLHFREQCLRAAQLEAERLFVHSLSSLSTASIPLRKTVSGGISSTTRGGS